MGLFELKSCIYYLAKNKLQTIFLNLLSSITFEKHCLDVQSDTGLQGDFRFNKEYVRM